VNTEEWQFFLRGGQVLDRSLQPTNPATEWLSEEAWDNITELELLPNFKVWGGRGRGMDAEQPPPRLRLRAWL
jgi:hypothetical protein